MGDAAISRYLLDYVASPQFSGLFKGFSDVMFFVKDTSSTLLGANDLFARHFGFSDAAELSGKSDFDLFVHELAVHYRRDDAEVLTTGHSKLNIVELFPDHMGELQWILCNKIPIIDANQEIHGLCGACQKIEGASLNLRPYNEISKALNYVKQNYTKRNTRTAHIAEFAGLSARQLEKRFKQVFNTSVHQYILNLRILKSCDMLLRGDVSIADTAHQLGFYDQSAFTSQFRRKIGVTPRKYIKRHSLNGVSGHRKMTRG